MKRGSRRSLLSPARSRILSLIACTLPSTVSFMCRCLRPRTTKDSPKRWKEEEEEEEGGDETGSSMDSWSVDRTWPLLVRLTKEDGGGEGPAPGMPRLMVAAGGVGALGLEASVAGLLGVGKLCLWGEVSMAWEAVEQ